MSLLAYAGRLLLGLAGSALRNLLVAIALPLAICVGAPAGFMTFACLATAGIMALHGSSGAYRMLTAAVAAAAIAAAAWWPYRVWRRS